MTDTEIRIALIMVVAGMLLGFTAASIKENLDRREWRRDTLAAIVRDLQPLVCK
jgi:hypothetical protein